MSARLGGTARRSLTVASAVVVLAAGAVTASAEGSPSGRSAGATTSATGTVSPSPSPSSRGPGGVIPRRNGVVRTEAPATVGSLTQVPQPPLQYLGGPVLRTNETYVIFWDPNGGLAQDYRDLVVRYFHDVAADSGKATNVYSVLDQYYDTTGPIDYNSTFIDSMIDTDAYPTGAGPGCSVSTAYPVCFTDGQLSAEVDAFLSAKGIQRTANQGFFVFTPAGVNTCFGPDQCLSTSFCAYHNSFNTAGGNLLYALVGYPGAGCYSGSEPNANLADHAINAASHEHREMIDDPLVGSGQQYAWLSNDGNESSDKCVTYYGPTRDNGTGLYNQVINGHQYLLQTEWSNAVAATTHGLGCVGNGADLPPAAAVFTAKVTGATASFVATSSSDPDAGDSVTYIWLFGDGSFDFGQSVQHQYASSGTYRAVLAVQDGAGAETETVQQVAVGGSPVGVGPPSVTITCTNSPCSASLIQSAIDNPSTTPGSVIAVGAGTYRGDITIDRDVTLKGDSGKATIDGTNSAAHPGTTVTIDRGTTAAVTGFTVTGGYGVAASPWGAGIRNLGVLALRDSVVTGNTGPNGGGIYNEGHLDIVGSSITANTSTGTAGGIANYAELTLSNVTVSLNRAHSNGGGLDNDFGATATITGSKFSDNIAGAGGGGGAGGAIDNYKSAVTVTNTRIEHNTAGTGGGIYSWRQTTPASVVTLQGGVTIRHNVPNDCAGSITC